MRRGSLLRGLLLDRVVAVGGFNGPIGPVAKAGRAIAPPTVRGRVDLRSALELAEGLLLRLELKGDRALHELGLDDPLRLPDMATVIRSAVRSFVSRVSFATATEG